MLEIMVEYMHTKCFQKDPKSFSTSSIQTILNLKVIYINYMQSLSKRFKAWLI